MTRFNVFKLPLLVGLPALFLGAAIGNSHGASTQRTVDAAVPVPTPMIRVVVHTRLVTRIVPHTVVRVRVRTITRVVIHTRIITKSIKIAVPVYRTRVVTQTITKTVRVAAAPLAPTATPTTQKLFDISGSDNKQSDTFTVQGPFAIAWNASYTDPSQGIGSFSIELDDAQGNELDLVSNASKPTKDQTTEHADCSKGCYIKVSSVNMDWQTVAVQ